MSRGHAHLSAGLLGVGLWASWFLPPLLRAGPLTDADALVALWGVHMLPLGVLLLAPWLGLEATYLLSFPAALVVPFAGAAAFDWPLQTGPRPADLPLAAGAFLLYAIVVPAVLRRSRGRRLATESRPLPAPPGARARRTLGLARAAAAGIVPLAAAYAAHFDRRLQLVLSDSYGSSAGQAAVLVDLCALAFGVLAADLALFAPLRSLRGKSGPAEIAVEAGERLGARASPRTSAALALVATAIGIAALAAYLAVRPQ